MLSRHLASFWASSDLPLTNLPNVHLIFLTFLSNSYLSLRPSWYRGGAVWADGQCGDVIQIEIILAVMAIEKVDSLLYWDVTKDYNGHDNHIKIGLLGNILHSLVALIRNKLFLYITYPCADFMFKFKCQLQSASPSVTRMSHCENCRNISQFLLKFISSLLLCLYRWNLLSKTK